jgi:hypothetical protein
MPDNTGSAQSEREKDDYEKVSESEKVPTINKESIEILVRNAALSNEVDPEVAMQLARLIFTTAALADGQAIAKITLKIHDTDAQHGVLRAHGKYGVCLACVKVDTQFGHLCASVAPGSKRCCLVAGSKVVVSRSGQMRRVEDLRIGDELLCYDRQTRQIVASPITYLLRDHARDHHFLVNSSLAITGDHPVLVSEGGRAIWRQIQDTRVGDAVFGREGLTRIDQVTRIAGVVNTFYIETASRNFLAEASGQTFLVSGDYARLGRLPDLLAA